MVPNPVFVSQCLIVCTIAEKNKLSEGCCCAFVPWWAGIWGRGVLEKGQAEGRSRTLVGTGEGWAGVGGRCQGYAGWEGARAAHLGHPREALGHSRAALPGEGGGGDPGLLGLPETVERSGDGPWQELALSAHVSASSPWATRVAPLAPAQRARRTGSGAGMYPQGSWAPRGAGGCQGGCGASREGSAGLG